MEEIKKNKGDTILFIVLMLIIISAAIISALNPNINKKIIVVGQHTNYAWGYSYIGKAILNDGTIYEWKFDDEDLGKFVNSIDWINKNAKKTNTRVPQSEIDRMEQLIEEVSNEHRSKKVSSLPNKSIEMLKSFNPSNNYLDGKLFNPDDNAVTIIRTMSRYDYSSSDAGAGSYIFFDSANREIKKSSDFRDTPNRSKKEQELILLVEEYI